MTEAVYGRAGFRYGWKKQNVHIQRMQKALTQMNVQLHKVVSDITGITGMAIIRAIAAGEKDPQILAAKKHYRAKRSQRNCRRTEWGLSQ